MADEKLDKLFKKYRRLKQYDGMTDEEVREAVKRNLEQDDDYDFNTLFEEKEERRQAKALLTRYLDEFTIETISDKNILKDIIYFEILNLRYQKLINEAYHKVEKDKDGKDVQKKVIPHQYVSVIRENMESLLDLKEKLGLMKKQDASDGFANWQLLKRKVKNWLSFNQATRHMACPYCKKMFLMKIRTDAWEAQKHPFFCDRIVGNTWLINLYKQNKLTKKDLAHIFETSEDYVDWLIEKWKIAIPSPFTNQPPVIQTGSDVLASSPAEDMLPKPQKIGQSSQASASSEPQSQDSVSEAGEVSNEEKQQGETK